MTVTGNYAFRTVITQVMVVLYSYLALQKTQSNNPRLSKMITRQAQLDQLQLSPETNKAHHEAIMALYIARANNGCRFHNLTSDL